MNNAQRRLAKRREEMMKLCPVDGGAIGKVSGIPTCLKCGWHPKSERDHELGAPFETVSQGGYRVTPIIEDE